jgi:hypothetical protein
MSHEVIKSFARNVLTEFARLSVARLTAELEDLKLDSKQFTVACLIIPNETARELEADTIAVHGCNGTRIVSGDVLTPETGKWGYEDYEFLEKDLLILQDAVDTAAGNLTLTLEDMKTRREKETH